MPFNATTYRANKYARDAWARLAEARDVKRRAAIGDAFPFEVARIPTLVKLARISMALSLSARRQRKLET